MKTSREDEDRKVIEERTKKMTFAPGFFDKSTLAWLSLGLILGYILPFMLALVAVHWNYLLQAL